MTGAVLLMAIALAEPTVATGPVAEPSPHWRGLVVVLVPPIDDDVTRNALARVSGELAAAPFRTVTKPIDPDRDVMAQVETAGSDQSATAAFDTCPTGPRIRSLSAHGYEPPSSMPSS